MENNKVWGLKVGVLTPATNLTVEEELWSMRVQNATCATARIVIDATDWSKPGGLQKFVEGVNKRLPETAKRVMQMKPDILLLGISSSNLWGGLKGNDKIKKKIFDETGIEMITPVDAVVECCKLLNIKKVGVVTPYPKIANKKIVEFFSEFGVEVISQIGLEITSPVKIGEVSEKVLCETIIKVDKPQIEAIFQLGTDLRFARVGAQAENWIGKPAFSVNTTTWWHCLRKNNINDKLKGWGVLFENY